MSAELSKKSNHKTNVRWETRKINFDRIDIEKELRSLKGIDPKLLRMAKTALQLTRSGVTITNIASQLGCSASKVTHLTTLFVLPAPIKVAISEGKIVWPDVAYTLGKAYSINPEGVTTWLKNQPNGIVISRSAIKKASLGTKATAYSVELSYQGRVGQPVFLPSTGHGQIAVMFHDTHEVQVLPKRAVQIHSIQKAGA